MSRVKWSDVLEELISELRPQLYMLDRDDPVSFCLSKRMQLVNHIKSFQDQKIHKSDIIAVANMKQGDDKFNSKYLKESLFHYSEAIFNAPEGSSCLYLAYEKRSRVLRKMSHFKEAIRDMDLAVSLGHPDRDSVEQMYEKAKCLTALGEYAEAEVILTDVLNKLNEDPKYKLENVTREQLLKAMSYVKDCKIQTKCTVSENSTKHWGLPSLKGEPNSAFPFSSNCLEVKYNEEKGRHVVAKCDVKMGDVLFVEKPFSFVVLKSICIECCEDTIAPVQCRNCVGVQFCSEKCRDSAWESYHKYECGFHEMLKDIGIAHLALRILFQSASNFEHLKMKVETCKRKEKFHKINPTAFSADEYENLYNLETHTGLLETEDLVQFALTASLLSLFVVYYTNYASETIENVNLCARILLRHITQLVSNAHAVTGVKLSNKDESSVIASEEQEQIASAIYPSASIMNHSCKPSIVNSFNKCHLIVRASKDINKGEEVFNCYGVHSTRMRRAERQELLKSQYHFTCCCEACTEKFDHFDVLNSFKCEKCKGALVDVTNGKREVVPVEDGGPNDFLILFCVSCGSYEKVDELKCVARLKIRKLLREGNHELYKNENVQLAFHKIINAWILSRKILYKYHKDLCHSANEIAQCLFLMGDFKHCIMFLKCSVLSVEGRFGRRSIELAFEAKKFSDVISYFCLRVGGHHEPKDDWHARMTALKYYEVSEEIFKLLYGDNHPIVEEIQKSKRSLL